MHWILDTDKHKYFYKDFNWTSKKLWFIFFVFSKNISNVFVSESFFVFRIIFERINFNRDPNFACYNGKCCADKFTKFHDRRVLLMGCGDRRSVENTVAEL